MAIERTTSIAKIEVISRGGHLACKVLRVVRVDWILERKLNGLLVSELVSQLYPNKINKQQGHNQPCARLKQCDARMVCYAGCDAGCICKIWQGMNEPGLNMEIQVCH